MTVCIPSGSTRVDPEGIYTVIGHSETGHHHVMLAERTELYQLPDDILECLLVVKDPDELTHLRPFDTHESIAFAPGKYRVRKLREYTPEGFRRQAD